MKVPVASALLLLTAGAALAQSGQGAPAAPSAADLATQQRQADERIEILNRQLAALTQIVNQTQRGIVVYPIAMALPGPIDCQGNCAGTVSQICTTISYPKSYAYGAVVAPDVVGTYVNGVCFGP